MIKKYNYFFVFILLAVLVFISYGQSLGLSLYGDDWLTISKYHGSYGPEGKAGGYLDRGLIFSNYGFQFISTGFLYSLFKDNALPYFYTSLLCRSLLAFSIFLFAKKLISTKTGIVASSVFAVSSIGAETTDWVYNFSSYLGISISLIGLIYFIKRTKVKDLIIGWIFLILSYIMVIIRLFILPILLALIELFIRINSKPFKVKKLLKAFLWSLLAIAPFYLIKFFFWGLGFQQVNQEQLSYGYKLALSFISRGQWDFITTPFTSLGIMIAPLGFEPLQDSKIGIIFGYIFLLILGTFLILSALKNASKSKITFSAITAFSILGVLKIFLYVQNSYLDRFSFVSWTYLGLIFSFICIILFIIEFKNRNKFGVAFYIVSIIFTFSFLFPWSYNPGYISAVTGRYNVVPSVGIALAVSGLFTLKFSRVKVIDRFIYLAQLLFLFFFFVSQVVASNQYFSYQLSSRSRELNETLFSQIKAAVPKFPDDQASLFYFEHNQPLVYENLLRFGFGYHMQLLYNVEFNDPKHPFSVGSKEDLIQAMTNPEYTKRLGYKIPPIDHVFAFRLVGDRLENITDEVRNYLHETIKLN